MQHCNQLEIPSKHTPMLPCHFNLTCNLFRPIPAKNEANTLPLSAHFTSMLILLLLSLPMVQSHAETNTLSSQLLSLDMSTQFQLGKEPKGDPLLGLYILVGIFGGALTILCTVSLCAKCCVCMHKRQQESQTQKRAASTELSHLLVKPNPARKPIVAQSDADLERQIREELENTKTRTTRCSLL